MEYPMSYQMVDELGAYKDVLQNQQSYNVAEVTFLQNEVVAKNEGAASKNKDAMLADLLKQPIMARAYKAAGIAPEQVSEYVESVLKMPENKKNDMIIGMYALYANAGMQHDNDARNQISDNREWGALAARLTNSPVVMYPMKDFVKAKQPTEPQKVSFGEKVTRWVAKRFPGAKELAVGLVFSAGLGAVGKAYISTLDKVEHKKLDENGALAKANAKASTDNAKTTHLHANRVKDVERS